MVLPCDMKYIQDYDSILLQFHTISYLLPFEVRQLDCFCELYYPMRYRTTLRDVLGHLKLTQYRIQNMVESIIGVLISAEEYFINVNNILWDDEYIFVESDSGKLQFCYHPQGFEENMDFRKIVVELMQRIDKKDETVMMYLLRFYNLITEPHFELCELKEFLKENKVNTIDALDLHKEEKYLQMEESLNTRQQRVGASALHNTFYMEAGKKVADENCENQKSMQQESVPLSTTQKVLRAILLVTALCNLILIGLLLFNVLTYDYVKYLFGTMGTLILVTIVYMHGVKEETPDEMMEAFFNENSELEILKEAPILNNKNNMQNSFDESAKLHEKLPTIKEENNDMIYGETVLLSVCEENDNREKIVEEDYGNALALKPAIESNDKIIEVEHSVVVGCMDAGCGYLLKKRGISRMHAKLMQKTDGLYILDLNSTNGTFLNGEYLTSGEEYKLKEGDLVSFAQCQFYVIKLKR